LSPVPQINSSVSADIRSPAPASQRNEPNDGFSQLLNTVGSDDPQPEEPQSRNVDTTSARPVDRDRETDRAKQTNDSDQTSKQDQTSSAADTDGNGATPVHGKSQNDDGSADGDTDGKGKHHKSKDKAEAVDATTGQQLTTDNSTPKADAVAVQTVVSAPAENKPSDQKTDADVNIDIDAAASDAAKPKVPQLPAPETDALAGAAAQSAHGSGKHAAKGKTDKTAAPEIPTNDADDKQPASADKQAAPKKEAAVNPLPANTDSTTPAPAAKPAAPTQNEQPNVQSATEEKHKTSVNSQTDTVSTDAVAKPESKSETSSATNGNHETLESALAKHFSGEIRVTNDAQIMLPDASRATTSTSSVNTVAQTTAAAPQNPLIPLTSAALAIEIASRSKDGSRQFDIRLDPPELGRIDVKLDVDKNGQVNTHLTVDRPETLDLLKRDSQGLERALQQAGLKTSDNGLEFSLRQQSPDNAFDRNQQQGQPNGQAGNNSLGEVDQTVSIQAEQYQWAARMRGGVDIRI
jgi:flagellar hook-length control protein FliK